MKKGFRGMGVAVITPFNKEGEVDFAALQRILENLISNGTDYLVIQGTTGESVTLTESEQRAVLDFAIEINNKRLPLVYGVGGNNTKDIVETLTSFDFTGVDAILSVSPYYNKPTQEGIYQHYKALDAVTPRPIILYNVPGRTGRNMQAETTLRIARECKNVIAIKEASGSFNQIMSIIQEKPKDFLVICGDDAIALPTCSIGADGVISVVGNAFPKEFSQMIHFAFDQKYIEAAQIHYNLLDIIQHLFVESNPSGVKEVMKFQGICQNYTRLPIVPVSEETSKKIYSLLAACPYVKI
ncbi:MAG: 4-hydroxy-tetrahydrodipicolinate synthase [Flavobacteriales bacterium]|nr:4-hydroxy-tetrahydrodipicolinate synthase [Flavobacteriales bacterium]